MFWYVQQRLYSIDIGAIALLTKDILHPLSSSGVLYYVLHSDFSAYAGFVSLGSIFSSSVNCVLRIAVLVDSVIGLPVEWSKCHSVFQNGNMDSILIHCHNVYSCSYFLHRPKVFGSNFVGNSFTMCADFVICARGLWTSTCCTE